MTLCCEFIFQCEPREIFTWVSAGWSGCQSQNTLLWVTEELPVVLGTSLCQNVEFLPVLHLPKQSTHIFREDPSCSTYEVDYLLGILHKWVGQKIAVETISWIFC